jgi:hypothetical protein
MSVGIKTLIRVFKIPHGHGAQVSGGDPPWHLINLKYSQGSREAKLGTPQSRLLPGRSQISATPRKPPDAESGTGLMSTSPPKAP